MWPLPALTAPSLGACGFSGEGPFTNQQPEFLSSRNCGGSERHFGGRGRQAPQQERPGLRGESRCEKQLLQQGRVRGGGRVDLTRFSPGRADSEAGRAAGLCPAPGKAETYGEVGGGIRRSPRRAAASLRGPPGSIQPLRLPGAASLVPLQPGGRLPTLPPGPCSGRRVEGLGLGTPPFPRRSRSSSRGQQPGADPLLGPPAPA